MVLKLVIISVIHSWMFIGVLGSPYTKAKVQFDVSPKNNEHFILLLQQDRLVLKTLLGNAVLFYENCALDMILEAYNATSQAGQCSVEQAGIERKSIHDQRKKLEAEVDAKIDNMIGKWIKSRTQRDLGTYWEKFWKERNELYSYTINKNGYCIDEATCGTGWGKMELAYFASFEALSKCKMEFWPRKTGPQKIQ